jgi:divalent metal cation (Fe/Co/Zn/Cd) transporter
MQSAPLSFIRKDPALYRRASALALITIFYNLAEGLISVFFGLGDESFALFGFGLDSFVEVLSGIGIWHLVRRLRQNGGEDPDAFERRALRTTGSAFVILAAGLAVTAAVNLVQGHKPESTFWGIVVSSVSIVTMWLLIRAKVAVGTQLHSPAILADAACTRTCLRLSVVLLLASAGYELTGLGGLDALGTMVIAVMSWREGREAFEKARTGSFACACGGGCGAEGATQEGRVA